MTRARIRSRVLDVEGSNSSEGVTAEEGYTFKKRTVYGQEEESQERIRVPDLPAAHAKVTVGGSVTKNLGDYNSARVEVIICMPCLPELSEIERVYGIVSQKVDDLIDKELQPLIQPTTVAQG